MLALIGRLLATAHQPIGARHEQRSKTKQSRTEEAKTDEAEGRHLNSCRVNPSTQAGYFRARQEEVVVTYVLTASLAVLVVGLTIAAYLASKGDTPQTGIRLSARLRKMRDRPVIEPGLVRRSHLGR